MTTPITQQKNVSYTIAGLCCLMVGLGFARFGYTPLLPLMISHHWLGPLAAGDAGAVNFGGYLLGAILAKPIARYCDPIKLIKLTLLACVLSLFACALFINLTWFDAWRFVAGFSGAILVIMTPGIIFNHTNPSLKGRIGTLMFSGMGFGILISGLLVPGLAQFHLDMTWYAMGLTALIAASVAWMTLPKIVHHHASSTTNAIQKPRPSHTLMIIMLALAYCLCAMGFTPHSLFLSDYISRYLHDSNSLASLNWAIFGIGAIVGTAGIGMIADRIGIMKCLTMSYLLAGISIAVIIYLPTASLLLITSFIMGSLFFAIVALTAAQLNQMTQPSQYQKLWSIYTVLFAIGQAIASAWMAHLVYQSHYPTVLFIAMLTLFLGFVLMMLQILRAFAK